MRDVEKQLILVDSSLAMPSGKMGAQVAHASLSAFLKGCAGATMHNSNRSWLANGQTKIVLDGVNKETIIAVDQQLSDAGITRKAVIIDSGFTVFKEPTLTCLGVGPYKPDELLGILKKFKLLP